jgi:hypothetical protein
VGWDWSISRNPSQVVELTFDATVEGDEKLRREKNGWQQLIVCVLWTNIPTYEIQAICSHCKDTTESLDHILTECKTKENAIVWKLTRHAWPERTTNRTTPKIGHILGCGNMTPNEEGTNCPKQRGIDRLKHILLSKSAYLLWILRCDRVIGNRSHTRTTIATKWKHAMEVRLDIDRRLARTNRRQHKKSKVLHTWCPIIADLNSLPPDWTTNIEVLVGIKLPSSPEQTGDTR